MDISTMFASESPYAKAMDTPDINKVMKIEGVGIDTLTAADGSTEDKVWLKFTEAKKPIILSKTNGRALVTTFGPDTDKWTGREVLVTTKQYNFDGKTSRGFITMPMAEKAVTAGELDDAIPF